MDPASGTTGAELLLGSAAATSKDAEAAFDAFIAAYQPKFRAAECLAKDRQALLAFYNFPVRHRTIGEAHRNPAKA